MQIDFTGYSADCLIVGRLELTAPLLTNMLNSQPLDRLALVREEGVAARAIRQLGIKIEPPPAKARGNGIELARQRWAEEAEKAKKATEAREATTAKDTEVPPDDRAA